MAKNIKTAAQALANFQAGMARAGAAYTQGTGAVQQSPMAAAAAAQDKMLANVTAAITSGQWAAALQAVPLSSWKASCAAAAGKLAAGAQKGAQKYQAAIQALQPVYQAMRQAAQSAGDDPAAKAAAAINVLVAAGKKGKAMGG
jgi:hypothetical protein